MFNVHPPLSLPRAPERDIFIVITYGIVVFAILVQGLTVGKLTARCGREVSG